MRPPLVKSRIEIVETFSNEVGSASEAAKSSRFIIASKFTKFDRAIQPTLRSIAESDYCDTCWKAPNDGNIKLPTQSAVHFSSSELLHRSRKIVKSWQCHVNRETLNKFRSDLLGDQFHIDVIATVYSEESSESSAKLANLVPVNRRRRKRQIWRRRLRTGAVHREASGWRPTKR
jgi:hypothetical protein